MAEVIQTDKVINAEEGNLRVWWIRNPPNPAEFHLTDSPEEARQIIDRLAAVDLRNPQVISNACGLEVFEDSEWTEWYDEHGDDIDNFTPKS